MRDDLGRSSVDPRRVNRRPALVKHRIAVPPHVP